jgi:hypothetical protein
MHTQAEAFAIIVASAWWFERNGGTATSSAVADAVLDIIWGWRRDLHEQPVKSDVRRAGGTSTDLETGRSRAVVQLPVAIMQLAPCRSDSCASEADRSRSGDVRDCQDLFIVALDELGLLGEPPQDRLELASTGLEVLLTHSPHSFLDSDKRKLSEVRIGSRQGGSSPGAIKCRALFVSICHDLASS